jgi:hypothetical protein
MEKYREILSGILSGEFSLRNRSGKIYVTMKTGDKAISNAFPHCHMTSYGVRATYRLNGDKPNVNFMFKPIPFETYTDDLGTVINARYK